VFYPRRGGVLVTDRWFYADGRRFAVDNLTNLGWQFGSTVAARRAALLFIAVEAAIATAVAACATIASGPDALAGGVLLVNLIITTVAMLASAHRWPTPRHLWGDYLGEPTLLYTSSDATEFHQVCRALMRATELNRGVAY
jgi:hypothetical protein